ncbi:MAG: methionine adenosyltransferase [Firmicutes bacterium]|nr:methionine adenosyltransferase [Bacillota bacterium]MCM1401899.1 methionine adenosyltransferase [Bacteroides sp.]MCM1477787.1 methionine adenosyltransferase [Bacteroides sp.]
MNKNYLFTSESVSEGHPDKVADQISDAILDEFLAYDPNSKVACETLVTTGHVTVAGEVKSNAYVDLMEVTRDVIKSIGYNRSELKFEAESCGVLSALHEQSPDINRGVERTEEAEQGAGDQGMMFGYACNETDTYMPLPLYLSHILLQELSKIRREGQLMTYTDANGKTATYLRPDSKSQVTVEYGPDNKPVRVHTIVVSTQHDDFIKPDGNLTQEEADQLMLQRITNDVRNTLIPRVKKRLTPEVAAMIDSDLILHVNPTGKFVIGGPHGDTGLTGRKIIVDTYGGRGAHGGGAFSGKDPSKVDRSAAYAARHIAKNLVAAGIADQALVQVAYAIGVAQPVSLYVNTFGTSHAEMSDAELSERVAELVDMRPNAIEKRLKLRNPIYRETASYGHMGREPKTVTKKFHSKYEGNREMEVELFTWEKLDLVPLFKEAILQK